MMNGNGNTNVWLKGHNANLNFLQAIKKGIVKVPRLKKRNGPVGYTINDPAASELENVATRSHEILFKEKTVFPFDLFPNTVTVDREKLTIADRFFFFTAKIISVPLRDILSVEVDVGPFFGSIHMTSRYFFTNPQSIRFLWRSHAIKLQRLLQGFIIAHERKIDCQSISKPNLERLLLDLGQGNTT